MTNAPSLHERELIRELMNAYFGSIDRKHLGDMKKCFAEDVDVVWRSGTPQEVATIGRDKFCEETMAVARLQEASHHTLSNIEIVIDGDATAHSTTFAVAYILYKGKIVTRGLRYDDRFVKCDGNWLIQNRRHTPLWQCEVPAISPFSPGAPITSATKPNI